MPASWVMAGTALYGALNGGGGSSGAGGGAGGQGNPYAAQAAGKQYDIANTVSGAAQPAYLNTLNQQNSINYNPYLQASQQAGAQYGTAAQGAAGQSQNLYDAGNQIYNTAFDPQNALYNRTQQQVGDQINAGQAQRGLGNSPVGAAEYGQGMSNFNIDWQNQQLQRQQQGVGAMNAAATGAGTQGTNAAQWMQTAAQLPTQAQQYVAGQPAANANQYASNMGQVSNLYGNAATTGNNYQSQANQAQQFGYNANTAQNTANANLAYQGGMGIYNAMKPTTPGTTVTDPYSTPTGSMSYNPTFQSAVPGMGQIRY